MNVNFRKQVEAIKVPVPSSARGIFNAPPTIGTFLGSDLVDAIVKLHEAEVERIIKSDREAHTITGETSDGYHTFNELYEYRTAYNAALFNEWHQQGIYDVHKSWKHSDGEDCFGGGWFIVMATLPTGQISNHYPEKDWDRFVVTIQNVADEWDGHTPQQALDRLAQLSKGDKQ